MSVALPPPSAGLATAIRGFWQLVSREDVDAAGHPSLDPVLGAEFSRTFNAVLRGHPRYPLALHAAPDPGWRQWRGLLAALGLTPA